MKIGLIECGPVPAEFAAKFGDLDTWVQQLFSSATGAEIEIKSYLAYEDVLPPDPDTADVWIIGGSKHSVTEQAPWMLALQAWIREYYRRTKIVGICFGHQIVAEAFGGKVGRSGAGWHAGIEEYDVEHFRPWMQPAADRVSFVASHQDEVLTPPPAARVLGGNALCRNGMMLIDERIFTIQLHPEMSSDCAALIIERNRETFGAKVSDFQETLSIPLSQTVFAEWVVRFLTHEQC